MNILIIGGLLGLAVVALLGAVLLGMGEDRAEKALKANNAAHLPPLSPNGQLAEVTLPSMPAVTRATGQLLPANEEEQRTLALHRSAQLIAPGGDEHLAILNGQVHEITDELRVLAHKAGELELRLNHLSEALERQPHHPLDASDQFYSPRTEA